jgi:hypothetical protein
MCRRDNNQNKTAKTTQTGQRPQNMNVMQIHVVIKVTVLINRSKSRITVTWQSELWSELFVDEEFELSNDYLGTVYKKGLSFS